VDSQNTTAAILLIAGLSPLLVAKDPHQLLVGSRDAINRLQKARLCSMMRWALPPYYVQHIVSRPGRHSSIPFKRLCVGLDAVAFTLIVDDLVYPDGSTRMGVLGGGGAIFDVTARAACYSIQQSCTREKSL